MGKWFVCKNRQMHYCGDGFRGEAITKKMNVKNIFGRTIAVKTLKFCGFCGKERTPEVNLKKVKKHSHSRRNIPRRR